MRRPTPRHTPHRAAAGFSLVELMVGITIALIVTLVIFNVLTISEGRKRSTTAVNDINQGGAYAAYVIDRAIRSAGSGFSNQYVTLPLRADLEGCPLSVTRGGVVRLPSPAPFPDPFSTMTQTPVLAPVIIDPDVGGASDVITVMSGSQGKSEAGARVIAPSATGVGVVNTFVFRPNDLVLFGHSASDGPCLISQVASTFAPQVPPVPAVIEPEQNLPLENAGAANYGNSAGLAASTGNLALGLGNVTVVPTPADPTPYNPPQFKMYGVNANSQLVAYDLVVADDPANIAAANQPQPVTDGVLEMHAVYGVDTTIPPDGRIDAWVTPTGAYAPATLRNGTPASADNLRRIVAVHVALIMRTSELEKNAVQANTSFTLYGGLLPAGLATRTINYAGGVTQNYRYRLIETTIPVRNNLL